jgi:hypothetical protein
MILSLKNYKIKVEFSKIPGKYNYNKDSTNSKIKSKLSSKGETKEMLNLQNDIHYTIFSTSIIIFSFSVSIHQPSFKLSLFFLIYIHYTPNYYLLYLKYSTMIKKLKLFDDDDDNYDNQVQQ